MEFKGRCGVDGGNICVIDMARHGVKREDVNSLGHVFEIPRGKYTVEVDIPNTYRGSIKKTVNLETSGDVYIGDACYVMREGSPLVSSTKYYSRSVPGAICCNTGGDGSFKVGLTFKKKYGG